MRIRPENRFFFNANAVGLAAHLRRPENEFLPAVASASLPVTGGVGFGESQGGRLLDLLSFGAVKTAVSGDFVTPEKAVEFTHGNYGQNLLPTETHAQVSVAALKIVNGDRTLEIDELVAALSSYSDRRHENEFRTLSAEFKNVRVDGVALEIKTHSELFTKHSTKRKLVEVYAGSQAFRDQYAHLFQSAKPVNTRRRDIPGSRGLIYTTVVSSLAWKGDAPKGATIYRNSVKIENFGSIYLGELLLEEGERRLTLLRFELGSPRGANGAAAEISSNGSSWPPK